MKTLTFSERFNNSIKSKKKSEQAIIFVLPIIIAISLSTYLIMPTMDKRLKEAQKRNAQIESQISTVKTYLYSIGALSGIDVEKELGIKLSEIENDILKNNLEKDKLRYSLLELNSNQSDWTNLLNTLANRALELNLKTNVISKDNIDSNLTYLKEREFDFVGSGDFKDIIRFMNFIELQTGLVKIKSINLDYKDEINFRIKITIMELII